MTTPLSVSIEAPAKINLGLEILGKRTDGFHEIRTVMAMLELADTLQVFVDECVPGSDLAQAPPRDNLVTRALDVFRDAAPRSPRLGWKIEKRVPVAAGLGGASSDAAAALVAANYLAGLPLGKSDLNELAARLGSDVPFFLGNPFAIASGRGANLEPLPPKALEVLLVVPNVDIPQKTATLYSLVRPEDFSDGSRAEAVLALLAGNRAPDVQWLRNAFSRPLAAVEPRILELQRAMSDWGAESFGLSGAGPAHYVLSSGVLALGIQDSLSAEFGDWLILIPTRTRQQPLHVIDMNSND